MKTRQIIATKVAELEATRARLTAEAAAYLTDMDATIAKWKALAGPLEPHLDANAKPAATPEALAKQFGVR